MKLIFKGFVIGIGKIIPGVSGSLLAINLGVYEQSIDCISNFFSNFKYNIRYLFLLGIGIILSICFFSKTIIYLLDNYYVIAMFIFIGLILGSTKFNKVSKYSYWSLISFFIIFAFSVFNYSCISISNNKSFFNMFVVGIVDAITMIIPGISGTGILMMMGAYDIVIYSYSNILNVHLLIFNLKIMIPFFVGIIFGFTIVSYIVNFCFKKYNYICKYVIDGFMYGTIFYMILTIIRNDSNYSDLLIGLIFGIFCFFGIKKINQFL